LTGYEESNTIIASHIPLRRLCVSLVDLFRVSGENENFLDDEESRESSLRRVSFP
jgi:hypothetical protein